MHNVKIPQEVLDACIRLRGRVHTFETIDPVRTALLVIDMQNAWVEPGLSPLGIPMAQSIIPNINRLAQATRMAGGIVAWTQCYFDSEWVRYAYESFGPVDWRETIISDSQVGAHGYDIAPAMDVQADDLKVPKSRPSAFIQGSSDIEVELRRRGRDTLIITGTLTNACCESSARDAAALGFANIMVSDAMATRTDAEHNATLTNVIQLVADVRTTDDVIGLLKGAAG